MTAEDELAMSAGCLSMIADRLSKLGCCCDHNRDSTPPMMYDDWITCAVHHARIEGMRAALMTVEMKRNYWQALPASLEGRNYRLRELSDTVDEIEAEIKKAGE